MRTEIQVFTSEKFGQLRTIEVDGKPYFVGKDIAESLGYSNTKDALAKHVHPDDKKIIQRSDFATFDNPLEFALEYIPNRGLTFINESGLYSLILGSKKDKAVMYKHWVTSEVLPSIHRTGSYIGKSGNPNVALVTITPEMAEEMLKKNIGNRKINQANVNRIAADMATGNYKLNGETIKISPNGEILDGQHRLLAAVKSGMTFRTYVVYNVERESIGTIDMGKGRSVADSLNVMGCNIKQGIIPAMNFYFNRGQKLTTAQTGCLWNTYEDKLNMICDVLVGSHHDYLLSQRDLRGFVIHLAISEKWSEDDLRTFVNGLKNKPNRDTTYELSAYNFRNWYDRKVHGKLRNLKSLGEKNKANVTLDALCTLAEGYTNDKLVRSFAWKNRAKGVLDTGYNIAQQRFITLTAESQNRIGMVETNLISEL